jgi:2,3-bisphosphoglycerate-dependent phosphoglycerate mutase
VLRRAIKTCWTVLDETEQHFVPHLQDWRLNERAGARARGGSRAARA